MFLHRWFWAAGLACVIFVGPAAAQTFRDTFKKPDTAPEFWAAMKYEIEVGSYNLAAGYLKEFLAKNPTDQELLDIEAKEGLTAFLQLQTIPALRKDSTALLERVSQLLQKHLADPVRIKRFIANLSASPEERVFAIDELRRSRGHAIPFMIEALRETKKDADVHSDILSAMLKLGKETIPPLIAALDVDDGNVRVEIIQVLKERGSREAVPYLVYLAAAPKQPEHVRRTARQTLGYLTGKAYELLPQPKIALTEEANRYYRHQVKFADPQKVVIWQMRPGGQAFVVPTPVYTASQAEEYYGLRFARQALDLDQAYEPAQVVLLSLAIDKAYQRAGLDQPLEKGSPRIKDLLRSVNPDLVVAVLDRALTEHRLPVILGAVNTLGEIAEVKAARQRDDREPALVRALNYPDRRVQIAAADALLGLPGEVAPSARNRVVEVLRRNIAGDGAPKALIADGNTDRANTLAKGLTQAGYQPVVVQTGQDILSQLREHTDFDLVIIDQDVAGPPLTQVLAQLRSDIDNGLTPVLITVGAAKPGTSPATREQSLKRLLAAYKNAWVLPASLEQNSLQQTVAARIVEATGKALSDEERRGNARTAMLWLRRMAVGELPGFEIEPARTAILNALRSKELSVLAVEAAGAMSDRDSQRELANLVLSGTAAPELRSQAAVELNRHIQRNGLLLTKELAKNLESLFESTEDAKLRSNLARVVGSMRPSAANTSRRLQSYEPPPVGEAAPEAEKKETDKAKPAEKDKDR